MEIGTKKDTMPACWRMIAVSSAAAVFVAAVCAMAGFEFAPASLGSREQSTNVAAASQHETQLLQWFSLAQGKLDKGRAPVAGERLAKTWGMRDGVIPTGNVVAKSLTASQANLRLSAAANARAIGQALRPLLNEQSDEDADRSEEESAPAWVREDYGETTQRQVHRVQAAQTAEFIEHQRAVAQQRWALALGLKAGRADGARLPAPEEQQSVSVDLENAPAWAREDYDQQQAAAGVAPNAPFATSGEKQDAAALADEVHLAADEVQQAELQLAKHGEVPVQILASKPVAALHLHTSSLHSAAQALVKSRLTAERVAEKKSAEQEIHAIEKESKMWTTHVYDVTPRGNHPISRLKAALGLSVYQDATLPSATELRNARDDVPSQLRSIGDTGSTGSSRKSRFLGFAVTRSNSPILSHSRPYCLKLALNSSCSHIL